MMSDVALGSAGKAPSHAAPVSVASTGGFPVSGPRSGGARVRVGVKRKEQVVALIGSWALEMEWAWWLDCCAGGGEG